MCMCQSGLLTVSVYLDRVSSIQRGNSDCERRPGPGIIIVIEHQHTGGDTGREKSTTDLHHCSLW